MTKTGRVGHLLVAHGSPNPRWRAPFEGLTKALGARHPERPIRLCYLEKWPPDVPAALHELCREGCREIRVSPLFLSHGRHLDADLPALIAAGQRRHPDLVIVTEPALGEQAGFVDALLCVLA